MVVLTRSPFAPTATRWWRPDSMAFWWFYKVADGTLEKSVPLVVVQAQVAAK